MGKSIAIITARGGSKRIPKKNIRNFLGKPMISYSIDIALDSKLFDIVMVSTDNEEIATISKQYGAEVPFLRSQENSDDFATTADVLLEVFNDYSKFGIQFDIACCIYPTAPLLTIKNLINAHRKFTENNFDTLFPIVQYSYPIQRSLKIVGDKVGMVWPKYLKERSQDLELRYHDAGQFYWLIVRRFIEHKKLFTKNSGVLELSDLFVQDIDNKSDWKLAELKYKLIFK